MAIKRVSKPAPKSPEVSISELLQEYNSLGEKAKLIETRRKELAEKIKSYAKEHGTKDDKGSYYSEQDNFVYGSTAKKTITLDRTKAEEFFKARGLWTKVTDTVEVINEDKVEKLVSDETITMDELESMTNTKVSYSVMVKPKQTQEEMPEVEVVSTKKIKSKK